jgi:ribonucleoside-diphosphate reductase alpha chain
MISDIYINAWKMGLKGLTTYRDNCRSGIMIKSKEDTKNRIKRKDILECDIHRSSIDNKNWIFFVGLDNGIPYEIFGGKSNKIEIPMKYKKGWIIKNGKEDGVRKYDLILGSLDEKSEDRLVIHDIAGSFAPEQGTFTRTISLTLRHSIPIQYICQQLHKDSANKSLFCFEKGVARVLKKYLKDGIVAPGTCEKCESKLIFKDGCVICSNCGYSKCD